MVGLIERLTGQLIVSCQPVVDGPLDRPDFVVGFALAAEASGAAGLRIEGLANLRAVRAATGLPIIGIVKRQIPSSPVFITPELADVPAIAAAGADIIAFDATLRPRPVSVEAMTAAIHGAGRLAMADCATAAEARPRSPPASTSSGPPSPVIPAGGCRRPPTSLLVSDCARLGRPVFAEGRYRTIDQVKAGIGAGASAIVAGSAITRPEYVDQRGSWRRCIRPTARRYRRPRPVPPGRRSSRSSPSISAGPRRWSPSSPAGTILASERLATPREKGAEAWLDAIAERAADWRGRFAAAAVAVTGLVKNGRWSSLNPAVLPIPPGFPLVDELTKRLDVPVTAMNDARAGAWGEYRHGAGKGCDMVYLTVSTGIGGGIVLGGRLVVGRRGLSGHVGQMLVGLGGENLRFEDIASGGALRREALDGRPRRRQRSDLRRGRRRRGLGGAAHPAIRRPPRPRPPLAADARRSRLFRNRRRRRPRSRLSSTVSATSSRSSPTSSGRSSDRRPSAPIPASSASPISVSGSRLKTGG